MFYTQFGINTDYSGTGIAVDAAGNLYVADVNNFRVRKIDRQGVITTIAGTGHSGYSGDGGPAIAAQLFGPGSLAFDAEGNLYIADFISVEDGSRVRKIDQDGIITTVAGGGKPGAAVEGGLATSAWLAIGGMAFDAEGNLYIADRNSASVRRVDKNGFITTFAGGRP